MFALYLVGFRPKILDLLSFLPSLVASTISARTTKKQAHNYGDVFFVAYLFIHLINAVLLMVTYCVMRILFDFIWSICLGYFCAYCAGWRCEIVVVRVSQFLPPSWGGGRNALNGVSFVFVDGFVAYRVSRKNVG